MQEEIRSLIKGCIRGEMLENEPLALHTSLKVGGPADLFAVPADIADLRALLVVLENMGVPSLVIGGGYNLLPRDGGFRGVVISLRKLDRLELLDNFRVSAEAGVSNGALARFAADSGLAGIEFLAGIPGTLGGALSMNAGAHGEAILDRAETVTIIRDGELKVSAKNELDYGYRYLSLAPGELVVRATLLLREESKTEIEDRTGEYLAHRQSTQRVGFPNAGSFFRNPDGMQAWRLIEDAGLRGCRIGGAQVSETHANFLVNLGNAKAADFIGLAGIIREKVKETSGITLEEEVRIVGEN